MTFGDAIALLNLFKNFLAVDGDISRSAYPQAYLFTPHFKNRDLYLITDHDTLIGLAR
jgi:hypothetical protein